MVRETQIEAWKKINENGLLSFQLLEAYNVVYEHGPMTSGEAFQIIMRKRPINNLSQSRARFTQLRDMGVLKEVGKRKCKVSGFTCIEWDVTSGLPEKPQKEMTRKERIQHIKDLLNKLERDVNPIYRARVTIIYNEVCKI